jgi:hypothetical protein
MDPLIEQTVTRHLEKGIDEEEAEEESEDFDPGDTPDNLEQHPYDEEMWQREDGTQEKECDHTDHRGRPLDEEECPHCEGGDDE